MWRNIAGEERNVFKELRLIMEQLNKIVRDYLLAKTTDYAIMINGEWGCGKSYYLDHDFKEVVENTAAPQGIVQKVKKCFGNEACERRYKIAYISLYGLSSAEDFYHRVFCGINSWTQNGFVGLAGLGLSKTAEFFGISAEKKDFKAITHIDTNQVLVFDDLERISDEKISIKEVLGLINKYAEHDNRKVIMVCNEEHFLADDVDKQTKNDYKKYKEKSIRFTYTYEADIAKVYDAIVSDLSDSDYKKCLIEKKDEFLYVFDIGDGKNLRTLKFFVDTFIQLFDSVKKEHYKEQLIKNLGSTLLIYVMEYKSGKTVEDLYGVDMSKYQIDTSFLSSITDKGEEHKEKDYCTLFREKYSKVFGLFTPCDAIVNYVANGCLEKKELAETITVVNTELKRQELTPEGIVYRKLDSFDTMEDDEIKPCVDEMMKYVEEGKYNIYDLLYVYALLIRYNYIGSIKLTKAMTQKVQKAILSQKDTFEYNPMFTMKTPIWDDSDRSSESYVLYNDMKKTAELVNFQAKERQEKIEMNEFVNLAESGDTNALRKMRTENKTLHLAGIDWKRICKLLDKGSNPVVCELCDCLMMYIRRGMISPAEKESIKDNLKPWVDEYIAKGDKRIRYYRIKELHGIIETL